MPDSSFNKLDNPAWYSLLETNKHFAMGDEELKRYPENSAPFPQLLVFKFNKISGEKHRVSS